MRAGPDELAWAQRLDVWSFGVTVWEVMERRRPFDGLTQVALQGQWLTDPYQARLPPVRLPEQATMAAKRVFRGLSGACAHMCVRARAAGGRGRGSVATTHAHAHTHTPADLVEDCTRLDPYTRPTFGDVLRRLKALGGGAHHPHV